MNVAPAHTSWPIVGGTLDGTKVDVLGDPRATTIYEPLDSGVVEVYRWRDGAAGHYAFAYDEEI